MTDEPPSREPEQILSRDPEPVLYDEKAVKKVFKLVTYLMRKHRFVSQNTTERSPIWIYDPNVGLWKEDGISVVRNWLEAYLAEHWNKYLVGQIITRLRDKVFKEGLIMGDPSLTKCRMVMRNGTYDLTEDKFYEGVFFPDEYQITGLRVRYDPNAICPKYEKFENELLDFREDIMAIEEFIGYCLLKEYPIAVVMMLLGFGANGKSTLLAVLRRFLGVENCAGTTPQQLEFDKFTRARLHGKLANIAGDIPSRQLHGKIMKMFSGNDLVTAEHKNQDPFDFVNYAKMIYSGNVLPSSRDNSDAYHRRLRVIEFKKVFRSSDPNTRLQSDLVAELTTEEELSGMFNLFLRGLKRFLKQGELTGEKPVWLKKAENIALSDSVQFFGLYCCEADPLMTKDQAPVKADVVDLYSDVSVALGQVPKSKRVFEENLQRWVTNIESDKQTSGDRLPVWAGLRLREDVIGFVRDGGLPGLRRLDPSIELIEVSTSTEAIQSPRRGERHRRQDEDEEKPNIDDLFEPKADPPAEKKEGEN